VREHVSHTVRQICRVLFGDSFLEMDRRCLSLSRVPNRDIGCACAYYAALYRRQVMTAHFRRRS
jgi:hypothetical protein